MRDLDFKLYKVSRVEIIDEKGRAYTRWNVNVEMHLQDDGRTIKLFVKERDNKE